MIYTATIRRPDGTTYTSAVDTTRGDSAAKEIATNIAESYGHELVSLGKEDDMDEKSGGDPTERESQQPDDQNKTTTERVDKQTIETKEVTPDKRGDVRPKQ